MKTDSGMRHGRWKHKGQREREGRGMRENRQPKVRERGGGRGYFSRKHILLYYRCSIMSFGSYMVANATFVQSNQLRKAETTQLGLEASCKKKNNNNNKKTHFKSAKKISRVSVSVITTTSFKCFIKNYTGWNELIWSNYLHLADIDGSMHFFAYSFWKW